MGLVRHVDRIQFNSKYVLTIPGTRLIMSAVVVLASCWKSRPDY